MRQSRSYGSVRRTISGGRPYRGPQAFGTVAADLAGSIRTAEAPQTSPAQPQALHLTSSIRALTSSSDRTRSDNTLAKASCLPQFRQRNVRMCPRVILLIQRA